MVSSITASRHRLMEINIVVAYVLVMFKSMNLYWTYAIITEDYCRAQHYCALCWPHLQLWGKLWVTWNLTRIFKNEKACFIWMRH